MRLSDLLNNAPDTTSTQVENFLGYRHIRRGVYKNIKVGLVCRNYFCHVCNQTRTYTSPTTQRDPKTPLALSCLMTNSNSVSIDVTLGCSSCGINAEAWFLIAGDTDLFSQAPIIHIERYIENRPDMLTVRDTQQHYITDLFERAETAYNDNLGSGAMIYLRKIFEVITIASATAVNLSTKNNNGKRKNFKELLQEVDSRNHIIPTEFSENGYTLFSELSEVIHGESDEREALTKYKPCKTLIEGVLSNIDNRILMKKAVAELGWTNKKAVQP